MTNAIDRARIERLMKRCQIGVGVGPWQMNEAHDIMAECYGTLGAMMLEIERLRGAANTLLNAVDEESPWRSWHQDKLAAWEALRRLVDPGREHGEMP
jgi:hypothetical protein